MGFFRLILLIMLFSALSLTGLVGLGTILPDAFGTGSGLFLLYVVGVSLTFLFFLKKHRGGTSIRGGQRAAGRANAGGQDATFVGGEIGGRPGPDQGSEEAKKVTSGKESVWCSGNN